MASSVMYFIILSFGHHLLFVLLFNKMSSTSRNHANLFPFSLSALSGFFRSSVMRLLAWEMFMSFLTPLWDIRRPESESKNNLVAYYLSCFHLHSIDHTDIEDICLALSITVISESKPMFDLRASLFHPQKALISAETFFSLAQIHESLKRQIL